MTLATAPSFQRKLMESNARINVIRAPRASGKTYACAEWALKDANKEVLWVVTTREQARCIGQMLLNTFGDRISIVHQDNSLVYARNGTRIRFLWTSNPVLEAARGHRCHKLILEEPGHMEWAKVSAILLPSVEPTGQVLAIGTESHPGSVLEYYENNYIADAYYDEYTYVHLINDGYQDRVENLQHRVYARTRLGDDGRRESFTLDKALFNRDFGPWNTLAQFNEQRDNEAYVTLLNYDLEEPF